MRLDYVPRFLTIFVMLVCICSGTVGIALASVSGSNIQLNVTMDPVRLGIAGGNYVLCRVDRSGRSLLERNLTSTMKVIVSIPAQLVLLIEVSE